MPLGRLMLLLGHMDLAVHLEGMRVKVLENHDLTFHLIPVTRENNPEVKACIMVIVEETRAKMIVLARYMQVLSDAMCRAMSGPRPAAMPASEWGRHPDIRVWVGKEGG